MLVYKVRRTTDEETIVQLELYIAINNRSFLEMSSQVDQDISNRPDRLRVIIVGGGVAGLTLAHCLHHNNIDYVVLERRKEIAPQVGASIVVLPNGARILDQLGIVDHLLDEIEPLNYGSLWTAKGSKFLSTDVPLLIKERWVLNALFSLSIRVC